MRNQRKWATLPGSPGASLKVLAKVMIGTLFVRLFPARAKVLERNLHRYRGTLFEKLLKAGLFGDAYLRGDDTRLMEYHRCHWRSPNVQSYYRKNEQRFQDRFLKHHVLLIDALERYLLTRSFPARYLVDIGCGGALTTQYLAKRFPQWEACIGIDWSSVQTEQNRQRLNDPRLHFVAADAEQWVRQEARPNTVFFANGGVLEYFSRAKLENLVSYIATALKPSLFLCIEPVAVDHDLAHDGESHPHGLEMTFSHNYPLVFTRAGYSIEFRAEQHLDGVRWLLLLAVAVG